MKIFDMHCDTLMIATEENPSLFQNNHHLDFQTMKKGDYLGQFFAVWMIPDGGLDESTKIIHGEELDDWAYINHLRQFLLTEVASHPDLISMAYSLKDMQANEQKGLMSAFLTLEDGRPVAGSLDNIKKLYDLGFRAIGLTWNFENSFGFPNSKDQNIMDASLKTFGRDALGYMNELGMIIDVSHLSDGGFWDVVEVSKKPFIASHSNARALVNHTRNLTDDMIKALGEKGGVTGINFATGFMSNRQDKTTKISDMIEHMLYIKNIGGIEVLAMGTDFDGISGEIEINRGEKMPMLFDAMKKAGFTEREIDQVMRENIERVLKDIL